MKEKSQDMERKLTCGKCKLFDPDNKICQVWVILPPDVANELEIKEGQKVHLPAEEDDECFYEQEFKAVDTDNSKIEKFKVDVEQVKIWVEDDSGNKTTNGTVKIEYPNNFWGKLDYPAINE